MKTATAIRWTIERAASEFGINPRTLSKRLKTSSAIKGSDGMFSTMQIAAAVFGDYESERTRLTKAQADLAELKLGEEERRLIPREAVLFAWEQIIVGFRQKILNLERMTEQEKSDVLADLQQIPVSEYFVKERTDMEEE